MRAARAKAQLTQQQLADLASISYTTVNRAENGQNVPEANAIARIADVLGVSIDDLFEGEKAL